MLNGEGTGCRAILAAGFSEDVGEVGIYRVDADVQGFCHLLIGCASGDQAQDFDFACSQPGGISQFFGGRVMLQLLSCLIQCEERKTFCNGDDARELMV